MGALPSALTLSLVSALDYALVHSIESALTLSLPLVGALDSVESALE